jgi:hypothetical protein
MYGFLGAALLARQAYWEPRAHYRDADGVPWVRKTDAEWCEEVGGAVSVKTVRRKWKDLAGIVRRERKTRARWDQTTYSSIDYDALERALAADAERENPRKSRCGQNGRIEVDRLSASSSKSPVKEEKKLPRLGVALGGSDGSGTKERRERSPTKPVLRIVKPRCSNEEKREGTPPPPEHCAPPPAPDVAALAAAWNDVVASKLGRHEVREMTPHTGQYRAAVAALAKHDVAWWTREVFPRVVRSPLLRGEVGKDWWKRRRGAHFGWVIADLDRAERIARGDYGEDPPPEAKPRPMPTIADVMRHDDLRCLARQRELTAGEAAEVATLAERYGWRAAS